MILQIIKYHRTELGETCSSEKVEKKTEAEAFREALKKYCQYASAYCADVSVLDWSLAIVNPRTVAVLKKDMYFSPDLAPEPESKPIDEDWVAD